jgi:flagellar motor switch protein FliM
MTDHVGYSDQATPPTRRRRSEARVYDFRRPVRLAREHAHLLKVSMSTFGRLATTVLTTSLRAVSQLSLSEIEELSYDEYVTDMPEGSVCAVLTLEPLPGRALLTLDLVTLHTMIDHLLGGPGTEKQPDRPLTDIEQALVRHIFGRLLRELAYALEPIAATNPQLTGLESNAQFVQAAAPTDPVVVARLELTVGQRTSHADLCLPYAMLSPALDVLSQSEDHRERAKLRREAATLTTRRLNDVEVDVGVRFDPVRLPSAQIGRLKVGDVLILGHRTSRPLAVTSASTTFALAIPGSSGKRLAALIVSAPQ